MSTPNITDRLAYLRAELRAERISYGELAELASLAEHIEPGDVELLEAAGVPEHPSTPARGDLMSAQTITPALRQYVETALWSSNDDDGYPLDDRFGVEDVAPETIAAMREDLDAFIASLPLAAAFLDPEQVAHDFWLTRNRHGAGFWDRGLGALGDQLTDLAHGFGETDLYVGDDELIYAS
jgi:hypothetical protein